MKKRENKSKSKNLHLGVYFGILVAVIIITSIVFKTFDVVKSSKFDGKNHFSVAIISKNESEIVSVSPKEGSLKVVRIAGIRSVENIKELGIPIDGQVTLSKTFTSEPKSVFTKILFNYTKFKTDLTILDVSRLAFYSQKLANDRVIGKLVSVNDAQNLSLIVTTEFVDPQILDEDQKIQITNTTDTPGLGNKFAKLVADAGGTVVLVNTSQQPLDKSKIYYSNSSYTVKKLSKMLGIPTEKKEMNSISDITIMIGKDREGF